MSKSRFWQFRAAAGDPKTGELLLYGPISEYSWWGDEVTPKQFYEDLQALGDIDELKVCINSGGGDVFAGQAIHSMLKRHKARVTVYVDGLAASIASVVAMAGDTVIMPRNAMMMIHNPWTFAFGDSNDFRRTADELDKVRESLIAVYEDKTGLPRDRIIELLDAETWMTAEEAVADGFADELEVAKQVAASLDGRQLLVNGVTVDLSRYRHPPKLAFLPGPDSPKASGLAAPPEPPPPAEPPAPPDPPKPAEPPEPTPDPAAGTQPTDPGERQKPLSFYLRRVQSNRNQNGRRVAK